jgi:hypothetical protein
MPECGRRAPRRPPTGNPPARHDRSRGSPYSTAGPLPSELLREGASLMAVPHRKQSKVSKSRLSGLDLLANIATPQIGQCFTDRGRVAFDGMQPTR